MAEQENDAGTRMRLEAVFGLLTHDLNGPIGVGVTGTSFINDLSKMLVDKLASDSLGRKELEATLEEIYKSSSAILESLDRATQTVFSSRTRFFEFTSTQVARQNILPAWERSLQLCSAELACSFDAKTTLPENIHTSARQGVLEAVFCELIRNSYQHGRGSDGSTKILLGFEDIPDKDSVLLRYSDGGRGIAADKRANIFKPSFSDPGPGAQSRLGLSIAHRLVTRYLQGSLQLGPVEGEELVILISLPAST